MRSHLFNLFYRFISQHPWKIIITALIITIASIFYSLLYLQLNANLDDLVSEKLDYHKRYIDFLKEFGDEEHLYIVVDASQNMPEAKSFIRDLASQLSSVDGIGDVSWQLNHSILEKNMLLFLPEDQLKSLGNGLTKGPFSLKRISRWTGLSDIFHSINSQLSGPITANDESQLSSLFASFDVMLSTLNNVLSGQYHEPITIEKLLSHVDDNMDLDGFYRNGDLLFIFVMPPKDFSTMAIIEKPLAQIRTLIADTKIKYPNINAGLTGRPVLAADEISTSDRDMTRATIAAIILVGLLFILFFRSITRPILAMLSLMMGISMTFGMITLIWGTLNILSIVFTLILIGASVEYGIHMVAKYQEELAHNGNMHDAIRKSLHMAGRANLTSACTTAAAFLTITWTKFSALAQLGFIAAAGIIFCMLSMIIVLPAMIVIMDKNKSPMVLKRIKPFILPLGWLYGRFRLLGIAIVVSMIAAIPFASSIYFDNNLLNLQAQGLESVKYEHLIIEKSSETTWFARSIARSRDESKQKAAAFAKLPSVRRVDDIHRIFPEYQSDKVAMVKALAKKLGPISHLAINSQLAIDPLIDELNIFIRHLNELMSHAFSSGRVDAISELDRLANKVKLIHDQLKVADELTLKQVQAFQADLIQEINAMVNALAHGLSPEVFTEDDLPKELLQRFKSEQGNYTMFIYPKNDIWNPEKLEQFISDLRSVDPYALGTPIEVYESGKLMRNTFKRSAILAFIMICLLVFLDFRSIKHTVIAVSPLIVGALWLFGLMGVFDIPFNMANFFAIPILIGIGVDFGVHLVHRIRLEHGFHALSSATSKAVLLTALTNAIGFGLMSFSSHQGIASLGQIMALGAMCCMVAAFFVLPLLAKFFNWGQSH